MKADQVSQNNSHKKKVFEGITKQNTLRKGSFKSSNADSNTKPKIKIKYAKEFFITEKGEIIKMAAIVTKNPTIIKKLEKDIRV